MEISLEQFIPSDKSKNRVYILKYGAVLLLLLSFFVMSFISILLGFLFQIGALVVFVSSYFSYIDYEYELYNGNIDISKIYCCSKRKMVQSISEDKVIKVYPTSKKDIGRGAKTFLNSNLNGLTVYTFELQGSKKVQVALNEKLERIIKIVYRAKMSL